MVHFVLTLKTHTFRERKDARCVVFALGVLYSNGKADHFHNLGVCVVNLQHQ
jgi:hypothetical protein